MKKQDLATVCAVTESVGDGDIVVIAKSPAEMEIAQRGLVAWATDRIQRLEVEAIEAETNLEQAKKSKWKVAPWKKAAALARGRVIYYQKIRAALEDGYVIMPDLPAQTLAVRTTASGPSFRTLESSWHRSALPDATTDSPPIGGGKYVSPDVEYKTWSGSEGEGGQKKTTYYARAIGFGDIDFPMTLVKPQILSETNRAMALKIFDEIGILPAGSGGGRMLRATKQPDPVVIGRIVRTEGARRIVCAFLITWWVDSRAL